MTDGAHDFLRYEGLPSLKDAAPRHEPAVACKRVTLTIAPLNVPRTGQTGHPGAHPGAGKSRPDSQNGTDDLLLLVVRVIHGPVGPIPVELAKARETGTARVPDLPWPAFPAAAEAIADWVIAQGTAHSARVVLLATRIPQELAVGLGVQLGQRSWERRPGQQWPQQVYPVFHTGDQLVIPDVPLGAESVPSQRR